MSKKLSSIQLLFGKNYERWVWSKHQLSYTTPIYISKKIAELTNIIYKKDDNTEIKIWDMFSGLGVDLISFGELKLKAYGTEISPNIYKLLEKNIKSHYLNHHIIVENTDCVAKIEYFKKIGIDVIYFDPPWGENYRSTENFDFTNVKLDNGELIIDILRKISRDITKQIIIKSPLKCNTFEELDFIQVYHTFIFKKHQLKFLFCKNFFFKEKV